MALPGTPDATILLLFVNLSLPVTLTTNVSLAPPLRTTTLLPLSVMSPTQITFRPPVPTMTLEVFHVANVCVHGNAAKSLAAAIVSAILPLKSWFCNTGPMSPVRSEEHTSELQSPYDLVCRL